MENQKLSPPWNEYVNKIKALFGKDPDIKIEYKDMNMILRIDGTDKYDALSRLLPKKLNFGGAELVITLIPANRNNDDVRQNVKNAFKGNPIISRFKDVTGIAGNPMTYIAFGKEVVQYYNDNIGDLNGNRTTLYEQLAREVFGDVDGVFFCTDNIDGYAF